MGAHEIWRAPNRLRRDEGRPSLAHGARTGEARARVEQTHCVLQPRHAADERTLSQRHARKFIRHREKPVAGGTVGILAAYRVRRLVSVRREHAQSRRGGRDSIGHRRGEGGAQLSHARYSETKRREPDVFTVGGCERVARVFEKEDGTWGGGEGRGREAILVQCYNSKRSSHTKTK